MHGRATPDEIRRTTREHRRNQGIYYTPVAIARYMARNSIECVEAGLRLRGQRLSVLDPSCGTGVFLAEAVKYLEAKHPVDVENGGSKPDIFGIDIDAEALKIAESTIPGVIFVHGNTLAIPEWDTGTIKWPPAFTSVIDRGGFDIVIGNPPYVPWDKIPLFDRASLENGIYIDVTFACRPNHADAQPNYYLFFIVRAASLINGTGVISFLLPQEWLYHNRAVAFRNYLLDHFGKIEVVLFNPEAKLFNTPGANAGTTSMILTLHKRGNAMLLVHFMPEKNSQEIFSAIDRDPEFKTIEIPFQKLQGHAPWIFLEPGLETIKDAILQRDVVSFDDERYFDIHGGFQPPVEVARLFEVSSLDLANLLPLERDHVFPLVHDAREIKQYVISPSGDRFWIVANKIGSEREFEAKCPTLHRILNSRVDTSKPSWWCFPNIRNLDTILQAREKILAPRTSAGPSFALDSRHSVFKGTNSMILSKKIPIRYVLGILNSKLSAFWLNAFGFQYHGGKTKKLEPSKARKALVPIKIPRSEEQHVLIALVNHIVALTGNGHEQDTRKVEAMQARIDSAVFKLYGITKDMQKMIDESL
nr:N-6 DNA methylase [Candidatus Sigynarchaeota archaeon]